MKPVVLIPADVKRIGLHPFHCVGEKYINAVAHGAGCWPLLVPAFGAGADLATLNGEFELDELLDSADGVFLPGSHSNVAPEHYHRGENRGDTPAGDDAMGLDPQRDALTLPLIRRALALDVPLFAVCRGLQELNVALGGTLHPRVHEVAGFMDHREPGDVPREQQYAPVHAVRLRAGGPLEALLGRSEIRVNSLHGQGLAELAPGLVPEAFAPDGLVEAVSFPAQRGFVLGVQWHPEWKYRNDPNSVALFAAFGRAALARARTRSAAT